MSKSETVEIKKHGNTYEDITFCPECGSKNSTSIKEGDYGHNTFIFRVYGHGKEYKCADCECEFLICKTDKLKLRHFNGFVGVSFFVLGVILIITAIILSSMFIFSLDDGVNHIAMLVGAIISFYLGAFFFYLCDYSKW